MCLATLKKSNQGAVVGDIRLRLRLRLRLSTNITSHSFTELYGQGDIC